MFAEDRITRNLLLALLVSLLDLLPTDALRLQRRTAQLLDLFSRFRREDFDLSLHQPIEGDEMRALRAWLREREQRRGARSPYLFLSERGPMVRQAVNYLVTEIGKRAKLRFHVHPHMLRHSTGYYLANRGYDTRLAPDYLGHKNIARTVRYTRTAAVRFEGLWR